jgi:hypothetical protein
MTGIRNAQVIGSNPIVGSGLPASAATRNLWDSKGFPA